MLLLLLVLFYFICGSSILQHVGQGFPLDWFTHTFNTLSVAMSILAVVLGPAVTGAHDFAGGNLGPFKASLLLTAINGCLLFSWRRDANKPCPAFTDMARLGSRAWAALIGGDGSGGGGGGGKVALVTLAQACFEAGTFAFGLLWTPLLAAAAGVAEGAQASPPWGIVFSQQLVCVMIGSVLFKLTTALAPRVSAESMCLWASVGGAVCFLGLSTGPSLGGVQSALLGYEVCVGMYLNAMGVMRSKYIPQEVRPCFFVVVVYVLVVNIMMHVVFQVWYALVLAFSPVFVVSLDFFHVYSHHRTVFGQASQLRRDYQMQTCGVCGPGDLFDAVDWLID